MRGASEEVSKNRNAAWPLGVATLGRLVPVLMAMARLSKCAREIAPLSNASVTSLM